MVRPGHRLRDHGRDPARRRSPGLDRGARPRIRRAPPFRPALRRDSLPRVPARSTRRNCARRWRWPPPVWSASCRPGTRPLAHDSRRSCASSARRLRCGGGQRGC